MPTVAVAKEVSHVTIDPVLPADDLMRTIAEDAVSALKYSFAAVAAEDSSGASGEVDNTFRAFLASRSAPNRARCQEQARALLQGPASVRTMHFGRFAAVDAKAYSKSGSDHLATLVPNLSIKGDALKAALIKHGTFGALVPVTSVGGVHPVKPNPDLAAGLAYKKMRLFITKVRCLEETDEIGSDEINLGGTVIDQFGHTSLVNEFVVSNDFDKGETVNMNKAFAAWNLSTESHGFPYVYTAVIAMAEKDDGGFYKFLVELWDKVKGYVITAVSGLVGAAIGAAIGSLAAGVGAIVGAVVGLLIGWIISLFHNGDDIVGVRTVKMTLGAATKSYYDWAKLTTPAGWTTTLNFVGDGGHYAVDVAFRIATQ